MIVKCENCGKEFNRKPNQIKKSKHLYCSRKCMGEHRTKNKELMYKTPRNTTHGLYNTRIYRIWNGMLARCEYKKSIGYKNYGGRGIRVCEEWHDVKKFNDWAINNGYKENLEIDRKDVNGNYDPDNCRWVTRKQNCNNLRKNIRTEINGEIHTLSEWSRICGIEKSVIVYRYHRGDRGERLIRKVTDKYDDNRKSRSNTGIRGISKNKDGFYCVTVSYKNNKKSTKCKTLEKAKEKLYEFKKELNLIQKEE